MEDPIDIPEAFEHDWALLHVRYINGDLNQWQFQDERERLNAMIQITRFMDQLARHRTHYRIFAEMGRAVQLAKARNLDASYLRAILMKYRNQYMQTLLPTN